MQGNYIDCCDFELIKQLIKVKPTYSATIVTTKIWQFSWDDPTVENFRRVVHKDLYPVCGVTVYKGHYMLARLDLNFFFMWDFIFFCDCGNNELDANSVLIKFERATTSIRKLGLAQRQLILWWIWLFITGSTCI